jgi:hypothetical protein
MITQTVRESEPELEADVGDLVRRLRDLADRFTGRARDCLMVPPL